MTVSHKFPVVGVCLAALLLIIQFLLQFQFMNLVFIALLLLMVVVAFLGEENRLLVWMIISFTAGLFAFIYIDRILLELSFSHPTRLVVNRFLFLIPIFSVYYVIRKFKEKPISFPLRINSGVDWNTLGPVKNIYLIVTGLQFVLVLIYFLKSFPLPLHFLSLAVLYSSINAIVIEYLWRGLFLYQLKTAIGQWPAIIFTSLSAGIGYYLFGYSIGFCCFFFLIGLLLGRITIQTNTLAPAMLYHFLLTLTYILKNMLPLFS